MNWKALGTAVLKSLGWMTAIVVALVVVILIYAGLMNVVEYIFNIEPAFSYLVVMGLFGLGILFAGMVHIRYEQEIE